MGNKYSIAEARTNLSAIVDKAEAGIEIELTRRGKPVAVLISHRQMERLRNDRPGFIDLYGKFLRKHALREIGIDRTFFQAVREKGAGRKVAL